MVDVKIAIESGDAAALRSLLALHPSSANTLIRWGKKDKTLTHPLHYVSDMIFAGTLAEDRALELIAALVAAGADLNYQRDRRDGTKGDTPLIGAASLGAQDVGLLLLEAGARPENRGIFGETALHWAALLGEDRLAGGLIAGSDIHLKDRQYKSTPLGWAIHGCYNTPAANQANQREVAALLVRAGAIVEPEWLQSAQIRADPVMLRALTGN